MIIIRHQTNKDERKDKKRVNHKNKLVGWLVGFYGISTSVGYLTPHPFLCI